MRILIDANILLDVLQAREPFLEDSALVWKCCEARKAEGYFSALTFANLVYILRKELTPPAIKELYAKLQRIFQVADLTHPILSQAASMCWKDYEDAVQSAIAESIEADFIVTRNKKDFLSSSVIAVTPKEFLEIVK